MDASWTHFPQETLRLATQGVDGFQLKPAEERARVTLSTVEPWRRFPTGTASSTAVLALDSSNVIDEDSHSLAKDRAPLPASRC